MLQGQSIRLIRDHVEADLVRHLERVDSALLAIVVRQAGLAHDIAAAISLYIGDLQSGQPVDGAALASRARRIEEKADRILIEAHNEIARIRRRRDHRAAREPDRGDRGRAREAACIASLLPADIDPAALAMLAKLCAAAVAGTRAAAAGADAASEAAGRTPRRLRGCAGRVGRLIDVEHLADDCEREATALTFRGKADLRASLSVLELARAIERATDGLAASANSCRGMCWKTSGSYGNGTCRSCASVIGGRMPIRTRPSAPRLEVARMAALGLPVPPAFVLPVRLYAAIGNRDGDAERELREGCRKASVA